MAERRFAAAEAIGIRLRDTNERGSGAGIGRPRGLTIVSFPFQFLSAVEVLEKGNLAGTDKVMEALNAAIDLSLANVPKFEGSTLACSLVSCAHSSSTESGAWVSTLRTLRRSAR